MNDQDVKRVIVDVLHGFATDGLAQNAIKLLNSMGYDSEKRPGKLSNTPSAFVTDFDPAGRFNAGKGLLGQWQSVDLLFQLTENEIKSSSQGILDFGAEKRVDRTIIQSYLFFAIALQNDGYTRTQLANITREINKLFPMPAMILFRHGDTLTLSIINRRLHKRDELKDVLEKVTLIKDINFINPHRAHIEILFDLSLDEAHRRYGFTNFVELHQAWQKALDSSELNKRFFGEIANWYFWATQHVVFPEDGGEDTEVRNATSVIRLITRLIFIWFVREKGLVPDDLFDQRKLKEILNYSDPGGSTYYKAILQNLFFATLNREMNTPQKPDNRKFRSRSKQSGGRDPHYNITNLYRYEDYFRSPAEALALFSQIPFLNGGLFECLDKPDKDDPTKILRIDGFSDRAGNKVCVPDFLFFCEEQGVDLNEAYGTANRRYKVRGLIDIFNRYKFTIDENTPIEEEVALDPELLGKVFENLLANYNPETKATARKQTGSYYTPREIVNYMVDESLIAYLETQLKERIPALQDMESLTELLREVFAYTEKAHPFNAEEVTALIEAIDDIKILDPACGSGAFPMGILHKLVFILSKLDPHNERWKDRQLTRADDMTDSTIRDRAIADIEAAFERNELDYGRKLYLIENCIYGVDIQPIAVQIARLRFFISLVVDQRIDDSQENRGIIPLPNLETKFVAANTLIGLDRPQQAVLRTGYAAVPIRNPAIDEKEEQLARVRKRHFTARTPRTKHKCREEDRQLRSEISALLRSDGFSRETTEKLAYWDPYDQNASADFFDPEWMFGISRGF
ncbi:MAG: Eco57I restriction-modification methylase domain-containing protein [Dehalococcoidia bacterium]